jgi:prepilin-type N-terminal cleavage/methylation domain-containing protein
VNFSKAGFTLIEVLVALTLLGLIATIVTAGTRLSLDISSRGQKKADALRLEHLQRTILQSQLQGALPYHYWTQVDINRLEQVAFEGGTDHLRFVSRYGLVDGPDALPRWIDVHKQSGTGTASTIVVEEYRILSPDNQPGDVIARAQILNCNDIHFDYLDTTQEVPRWVSGWVGSKQPVPLPSAVRISCGQPTTNLLVRLDYTEPAAQGMWFQ